MLLPSLLSISLISLLLIISPNRQFYPRRLNHIVLVPAVAAETQMPETYRLLGVLPFTTDDSCLQFRVLSSWTLEVHQITG